jgi:hypothetical protein
MHIHITSSTQKYFLKLIKDTQVSKLVLKQNSIKLRLDLVMLFSHRDFHGESEQKLTKTVTE